MQVQHSLCLHGSYNLFDIIVSPRLFRFSGPLLLEVSGKPGGMLPSSEVGPFLEACGLKVGT